MNPSAIGWIKKLQLSLQKSAILKLDKFTFYNALKETGFIYGSNFKCICKNIDDLDFNEEERCKVNLVSAFYYIHHLENNSRDFVDSVISFYNDIDEYKRSFIVGLFGEPQADKLLEQIIHKRIHIDDNIITKNFNYFLINAFLFIDIVAYHYYITKNENTKTYFSNFEAAIEQTVFSFLYSKTHKTTYDDNLIKLYEASLRNKNVDKNNQVDVSKFITGPLEKRYLIDTLCMASWSDQTIDNTEYAYINKLNELLDIEQNLLTKSVDDINRFYKQNAGQIAFLSSKNMAQSFYDNSSGIVKRLIKRNSKRLNTELLQSKEAMLLLTQSTIRNLTEEEQKKVQNQLLDIFKSIPSLAIFMLPGGMLLMPLFIKFIPKLLPSAFDDNRIEE